MTGRKPCLRGLHSMLLRRWRILGYLLFAGAVAGEADAQQFLESPPEVPSVEFSFSNSGARSMGFGGAFVALADDATAPSANAAGLVQIVEPEVSIEGRRWSYLTPYVEGGKVSGSPTGIGLDVSPGLRMAESSTDLSGVSFLSFVYPGEDWSFAVYRHLAANFEFFGETQGLFAEGTEIASTRRYFDQRVSADFEIASYGLSGAYRLSETWSVGAGVACFAGSMLMEGGLFRIDVDDQFMDDADEIVLGVEYACLELSPVVPVRLGGWLDPNHRAQASTDDPLIRALRSPGDDQLHYAAGLGVAFQRFDVDLGIDLSELVDTAPLSAIFSS